MAFIDFVNLKRHPVLRLSLRIELFVMILAKHAKEYREPRRRRQTFITKHSP